MPSVIPYEIQVTLLQEWSNMTPEQERKAKTQVIDRFVSRYMKGRRTKKVPWQQLEGQFTLHVLSFSGPKLTSYDDAHRVIFAYQGTREILKTIQLKLSMMR